MADRHLATLSTIGPAGGIHVVAVGFTCADGVVRIITSDGSQKVRNVERDPRVAVAIQDPENPFRYIQVRGEVISMTTEGGVESIEALSQKYLGAPYPWFGGRDQVRVVLTVAADRVHAVG